MDNTVISKYQDAAISSLITGIVLLVSLAWNDFIKSFIKKYFPVKDDNTIHSKLIYALVITFLVISLQIYLFPYIKDDYEF